MPRSATSQAVLKPVTAPQTQDAEVEEIISGHLTQTLWMDMLMNEEAEEAVEEVMEQLLSQVMDACFKVDIKRQLVPFTTAWVKNWLVQTVEQHFLCRIEGDEPEDISTEDSEPPPADPDAWAEGYVPLLIPSQPLRPISSKAKVNSIQVETMPKKLPESNVIPKPDVSPALSTKKISPKPVGKKIYKMNKTFPQPKMDQKKIHHDLIRSKAGKFLPPLSHSTEKKTMKTDLENRTSSDRSHVTATNSNKHPAIQKLDPASLPDHCIFPTFEIIDNHSKHKNARDTKLIQRHKKMESDWTAQSQRNEVDFRPKNTCGHKNEGMVMSGPLRLDAMTLAKGVCLSNTQAVELNRPTDQPPTPPVKLKPIRSDPAVLMFSVDQFVVDPQHS